MCPEPRYDEPFHWWGPGWEKPAPRHLGDLLRDGTIDPWHAAILWATLARRRSLLVVSGPSGVGKTTLLTALLELLPAGTRRIYLRGCFESFAFLSDPTIDAKSTALLVNEISPHLPVYLWGPAVARALQAANDGFTLLGTAHAVSAPDLIGTLAGRPLRVPAPLIAAFEFVVIMEATATHARRRVQGIWRLRATRDGVDLARAPTRADETAPASPDLPVATATSAAALWFPRAELVERSRLLRGLRDRAIVALPELGEQGELGAALDSGEGPASP